jgi:ketosteroid isomerase-like protein
MDWRRKAGDRDARLDSVTHRGDGVVVAFSWSEPNGKRHEWAQVLHLKDGKIIAMQDYAKASRAALGLRLRTALT